MAAEDLEDMGPLPMFQQPAPDNFMGLTKLHHAVMQTIPTIATIRVLLPQKGKSEKSKIFAQSGE